MGFRNVVFAIERYFPEVERPKRHVPLKEKFMWTGIVLLLYFILAEIPLYGIPAQIQDYFATLRFVLAGRSGSLLTLGIGPIVTASIVMQLFAGAKIINRPKNLTKNSTNLEDIAYDAISKICKENNFEKCLILNPKYPLIKNSTIKKFLSILSNNIQTVYGFEYNPEHQYKKISFTGKDIGKILNDIPNCVITEKIVSFNTQIFLKSKKFQSPFFGLKLSENEPLALNSYHDFGILEKILNRKRIMVRVDGSDIIGLGHVHNMLTILNHFRNEEILIVMNSKNNLGQQKFQEYCIL
jgi:hypothetical protein